MGPHPNLATAQGLTRGLHLVWPRVITLLPGDKAFIRPTERPSIEFVNLDPAQLGLVLTS